MRIHPLAALVALPLFLVGCSTDASDPAAVSSTVSAETGPTNTADASNTDGAAASAGQMTDDADLALPFDAMPIVTDGTCPYLDTQWVADTNGQRVTREGIDPRFDPPACVWWSYQDDPQLTVLVRHMANPDQATAVVDWAAPVETTNPAEEPEGWSGGRFGGDGHSVYAVAKDSTAVVVFSNQEQSIKPELIAKEVIANLNL